MVHKVVLENAVELGEKYGFAKPVFNLGLSCNYEDARILMKLIREAGYQGFYIYPSELAMYYVAQLLYSKISLDDYPRYDTKTRQYLFYIRDYCLKF